MIRCNLAVLLAERGLKISKVSEDTGISRTTLTSLSNNYSQGIQFDTLNELCSYLDVSPEQILLFSPVDISDISAWIENLPDNKFYNGDYPIQISMKIRLRRLVSNCSIPGILYTHFTDGILDGFEADFELWDETLNPLESEVQNENRILKESFQKISPSFFSELKDEIVIKITEALGDYFPDNYAEDIKTYISLPKELSN